MVPVRIMLSSSHIKLFDYTASILVEWMNVSAGRVAKHNHSISV